MIAKNLRAGRFFSGILNYAFEGKELEHQDKKAEVLLHSPDLIVPHSKEDKEGMKDLIDSFNARTIAYLKEHPENKQGLIGHQILSFTPEDETRLGRAGIQQVLADYVNVANLDKTKFVSVAHKDTSNYHIHLLFHKVGDDGKKLDDWKLNNKTLERGVALALKNGLSLIKDQARVALTRGVLQLRSKDSDIANLRSSEPNLRKARNMRHLEKLMEASKVRFDYLQNDRVRVGAAIHTKANLEAVFFLNRTAGISKENRSIDKDYFVRTHPLKIAVSALSVGEDRARSIAKEDRFAPNRSTVVTIQTHEKEAKPLRRKRKGKQHLLKNRPKQNQELKR